MTEQEYKKKINELENEISYLRELPDNAGIPYSFTNKPESENLAIISEQITPRHAQYFYSIFKGRRDVYAKRGGKLNPQTGKVGLGNLVALPLQGQALKNGNSAFIDENNQAYPDQWQVLREIRKIEKSFIEQSIQAWSTDGSLGILSPDIHDDTNAPKPWEKPEKMIFSDDITGKVEIVLSDRVYLNTKNIKPRTQNYLRRMAAFKNPNFYKNLGMGFSIKGIPRIIYCGYDECDYICLPRALKEPVLRQFDDAGIAYSVEDKRQSGRKISVDYNGKLYPEQQSAADAILSYENGILAAATAFGKTVVGAYMIAQRKTSTLIIVLNTEILKNWVADLEKFLDIHEKLPTACSLIFQR